MQQTVSDLPAPHIFDGLASPRKKRIPRWVAVCCWIASSVAGATFLIWFYMQSTSAVVPTSIEPEFCVSADGSIFYIGKGKGGSDVYRFDRKMRTTKAIAATPFYESEPDISPDGKNLVCRYRDSQSGADGFECVDIATGQVTRLTNSRSGRDVSPHFSPDGKKIVFGRKGISLTSNSVTQLYELDLLTRQAALITPGKYYAIYSPLYLDVDHVVFSADVPQGNNGNSQRAICTFSRKSGIRTTLLPPDANMKLIAQSPDAKMLFALTTRQRKQNNAITWLKADQVASPGKWNVTAIATGDARFYAVQNEILYRNENANYYVICGYSLTDRKTRYYVKIKK